MNQVPIGELVSRGVHPRVAAVVRIDPYWDGLWTSSSTASWSNVTTAAMQERAGLAQLPANLRMDPQEAWERFTHVRHWRRKLELLGVLGACRTVSAEQLAAFVGAPSLAGSSRVMDAAFACGLVDQGVFASGLMRASASPRARSFRPADSDVFDKRLASLLTYPELTLVTGGARVPLRWPVRGSAVEVGTWACIYGLTCNDGGMAG